MGSWGQSFSGSTSVAKKGKQSRTNALAEKLGVSPSTIRSRMARGTSLSQKRQLRLTEAQKKKIAKAKGPSREVAERFGCSPTTVKRLRRELA